MRLSPGSCALVLLVLFGAAPVAAQSNGEDGRLPAAEQPSGLTPTPDPRPRPWSEWTWATGDWPARARLADRGVSFDTAITADFSRVSSIALGHHDAGRALIDARLTVGAAALGGWQGMTASAQYYAKVGADGTLYASSLQGVSNIDAESFSHLGELWIEQVLARERVRVKVGRVDANTEFAAVDAAGDFINPSMGYSPTILFFPTYPDPRFGVNVAVNAPAYVGIGLGVYRGTAPLAPPSRDFSAGVFAVGEVRAAWEAGRNRPGRLRVGAWRDTGPMARIDGVDRTERGARGPYVTFEQTLWRQPAEPEEEAREFSLFVQYGTASERVTEIAQHLGAGLTLRGLFRGRPADVAGIGVTSVRQSPSIAIDPAEGVESVVSAFYKYRLARSLHVQPDVQYVFRSAAAMTRRAGLFVTCRLRVDL